MPPKSAMIRARVEPRLKREAEKVLRELGLGASEAISIFYAQIARRRALPFAVALDAGPEPAVGESPIPDALRGLDAIYKRLEELDEWRTFAYDAAQLNVRK